MTKKCFINLWPDLGIFPGIGVKEYCMTDVLPKFHCVPSAIVGDMALLPYPFQSRPCYHTSSILNHINLKNSLFSKLNYLILNFSDYFGDIINFNGLNESCADSYKSHTIKEQLAL
mgnify:CR=1 FL=1